MIGDFSKEKLPLRRVEAGCRRRQLRNPVTVTHPGATSPSVSPGVLNQVGAGSTRDFRAGLRYCMNSAR